MQLLSDKNLSRNLPSRVADREADSAGVNVLMFSSRVITFYG